MADLVFNVAKGRAAQLAKNVDDGSPANSALIVVAINAGAATDATIKDYDTLAALLADVDVAEVTNTNYARKSLVAASVTVTIDDTNDRIDVDISDQTWSAVAAGSAWTDLVVCYDADTTAGTDTDIIPLTLHDFAVTPDGSDITAQIATAGIFRAS